jgi:hypothetical protein
MIESMDDTTTGSSMIESMDDTMAHARTQVFIPCMILVSEIGLSAKREI